jgi:beta-fructofuranosidase
MVHWTHLPVALYPDMPYDNSGIFSGSATVVNGVPVLSYSVCNQKVVGLAVPSNKSDPFLTNWSKPAYNPVMKFEEVENYTRVGQFRDPTEGWKGKDGVWRMLTGCDDAPCLFKSHDFINWFPSGQLRMLKNNTLRGKMLECPGFHPIPHSDDRWFSKVSWGVHNDFYSIGTFDSDTDTFSPDDAGLRAAYDNYYSGKVANVIDYGNFYAGQSVYDPVKDRRVLFGWAQEETGEENYPNVTAQGSATYYL